MSTILERVAHLVRMVPATAENPTLLCLLYWRVYDDVDIPGDVMCAILERGTNPESLLRYKRRLGNGDPGIAHT
ncbi:MAG: hypothetical protein AB1330_01725 [Bacillota bacterium]